MLNNWHKQINIHQLQSLCLKKLYTHVIISVFTIVLLRASNTLIGIVSATNFMYKDNQIPRVTAANDCSNKGTTIAKNRTNIPGFS